MKRNGKVVRLRHNSGIAMFLYSDVANVVTLLILVILIILANWLVVTLCSCSVLFSVGVCKQHVFVFVVVVVYVCLYVCESVAFFQI